MDPLNRFKNQIKREEVKKQPGRSSSLDYRTISGYSYQSHRSRSVNCRERSKSSSLCGTSGKFTLDPILQSKTYRSIKLLKEGNCNHLILTIKQNANACLKDDNKQKRFGLTKALLKLHPFFNKIYKAIGEAIVLLGKLTIYLKGQIISELPNQSEKCRSKNDLGFMVYGKVQLFNEGNFYTKIIRNFNTFFEQKYIRQGQINDYKVRVLEDTMVLWLPRQSFYTIRKECFLKMDLKYKFHEFQNLLKYYFIHKKTINY